MKTKKIIKALKKVYQYCENRICDECIFNNGDEEGDDCLFYCDPDSWDIEIIEEKLKRIETL